ncbi:MAG TPA: SgcJ/EcaC family oxidoreductase [Pseudonocardiaceae bacterium]
MTTTVDQSTDVTAVHALLARFYDGWTAHDADAMAALYVEDATVAITGQFHQGRSAIRDFLAGGFAGPIKGSRGVDTPLDVRIINGNTAIVVSTAGVLMPGEQSVPADRQRVATWTLSKQDGEWLIAAYANSPAH